jgi:hypothetical protein
MCAGVLPSAYGESDKPHHEEDGGRDPQEMDRESGTKKDQYEQQSENQEHGKNLLLTSLDVVATKIDLVRGVHPADDVPLPVVHDGPLASSGSEHHDDD